MSLKHLEHDGNDDFSNRKDVKDKQIAKKKEKKDIEQEKLEQDQDKYMSIDNPVLWEGEI